MSYSCPISFKQIDSNVSRINSLFVSALIIIYIVTPHVEILYLLALDFMVKLFLKKEFSLIYQIALMIKKILRLDDVPIDSGSKRLASYFGLMFVCMLIVTHFLNLGTASFVIAAIFVSCSLLDLMFNFCVGCKIYYIIKKIYPAFMS